MKVLVTGANGFIGKNLISHLQELDDIEIFKFDIDNNLNEIQFDNIDFIFHLAGVNRPSDNKEFYKGNTNLTETIVELIKDKNIPILLTSTIQADNDSDYGKSKRLAEETILKNCKKSYIYRLHNVFGKWCKPNYNSVVATFCNNIANDLEITITNENTTLKLIYIDDIMKEFINILYNNNPSLKIGDYCYINIQYEVTLGQLSKMIYDFKDSMNSILIPKTGDDFIKKLYSTYISYLPLEKTIISAIKNTDERGFFSELVRTNECGQVSLSYSNPGVVRGNHYHHTKIERFIVIKGKAQIRFTNVMNETSYEFIVDDSDIKIVTIPVGYTHSIENIGKTEMILIIWCNELFNKDNPDTYFKKVNIIGEG